MARAPPPAFSIYITTALLLCVVMSSSPSSPPTLALTLTQRRPQTDFFTTLLIVLIPPRTRPCLALPRVAHHHSERSCSSRSSRDLQSSCSPRDMQPATPRSNDKLLLHLFLRRAILARANSSRRVDTQCSGQESTEGLTAFERQAPGGRDWGRRKRLGSGAKEGSLFGGDGGVIGGRCGWATGERERGRKNANGGEENEDEDGVGKGSYGEAGWRVRSNLAKEEIARGGGLGGGGFGGKGHRGYRPCEWIGTVERSMKAMKVDRRRGGGVCCVRIGSREKRRRSKDANSDAAFGGRSVRTSVVVAIPIPFALSFVFLYL
ncbi:hypothetical protein R3P38DRAFT_2771240 [Favolaschia claudopus]|uniref:Uncharacterized protein n=1 Tax=Favolaschia claudopus TaxID=2862362 RepID=A0AAW0C9V9_9AGAR